MNTVQMSDRPSAPGRASRPSPAARWGAFVARRRRLVASVWLLGVVVAAVLGVRVFGALQSGGFDDTGAESARAAAVVADEFGVRDPAAALAVQVPGGVDDATGAAAATRLVNQIAARPDVESVVSYWTSGRPESLRSTDGTRGEVLVAARDHSDDAAADLGTALQDTYGGSHDGLHVDVGGAGPVNAAISDNITSDLARAESIAVPITVVLLIFVFGSLVSAGLPFLVALGAIVGSFAAVWGITVATDVSVFALNLITGLGLGLGIDYALLVVNRHREELRRGLSPEEAVARTVATAGRTVVLSGLTVAVVLASLLLFPQYFLQSFGWAGIAVTLLASISAVTVLPAVLAMLGHRVDRFTVWRGATEARPDGAWSRVARTVMRRPWPVLLGTLVVLGIVAAPAVSAGLGQVDARALPASDPAAVASRVLTEAFPGSAAAPVDIVLPGAVATSAAAVDDYAVALTGVDGVTQVTTPTSIVTGGRVVAPNPADTGWRAGDDIRVQVLADVEPASDAGRALVVDLRAVRAPVDGALVGGAAAVFTDSQDALAGRGLLALGWIVVATLVMLFLFTGSVVLPVKAVLLNVVTLAATIGALTWVFQDGHLGWLVGDVTTTGSLDTSTVVLIAVVAFALSMDYEMFLLSRIKEEHDSGTDTTTAVATGLQRSGRIITAAAVLIAVVFASFVSSGVTNIKELGFGVAFAILVDATVVRGLLVPAFMRLAGRWNWWAPAPLRALHRRIGLAD